MDCTSDKEGEGEKEEQALATEGALGRPLAVLTLSNQESRRSRCLSFVLTAIEVSSLPASPRTIDLASMRGRAMLVNAVPAVYAPVLTLRDR